MAPVHLGCRTGQALKLASRPLQSLGPAQVSQYRRGSTLSNRVQIYRSPFSDPYLNLSIEHHLLQHTHPESTVLFTYVNRPCVVIGRNQNPWLEVNLRRLEAGIASPTPGSAPGAVSLVRRRSGGGTVFHDEGNINWTVICPPAVFDRDRHAEMVVRALRRLGVQGVRVNERHDIVQDVQASERQPATFKVSGSAYKLTRLRSLHHGTCLLSSPNLGQIGPFLRSPAEPYIKARGVESVRSPIRNVGVDVEPFKEAVTAEFEKMYGAVDMASSDDVVVELAEGKDVAKGLDELRSLDWIYGQTPQFTFCTQPTEEDPRERPEMPDFVPPEFRASFTIRHGQIQEASVSGLPYAEDIDRASQDRELSQSLLQRSLYHIGEWTTALNSASPVPVDSEGAGRWLNQLFGAGDVKQ